MTINDDIKAALSTVPGLLGQVWRHRIRTSARDIRPVVFASFTNIPLLALDETKLLEEDDNGDELEETFLVRFADSFVVKSGDQMEQPVTLKLYHVVEQISSGIGGQRWRIERAKKDNLGDLRGGGLT